MGLSKKTTFLQGLEAAKPGSRKAGKPHCQNYFLLHVYNRLRWRPQAAINYFRKIEYEMFNFFVNSSILNIKEKV